MLKLQKTQVSSIHVNWHLLLEIPIITTLKMDIKMIPATMIMDHIIREHVTVTQMAAIKALVSFIIQKYPLLKSITKLRMKYILMLYDFNRGFI